MGYTFLPTSSGTIQVSQDGKVIGTGTSDYAKGYGYEPASDSPLVLSAAPVKGEPAVLSTISGRQNFDTKIQPIIDSANRVLESSNKLRAERDAAAAARVPGEQVPADVQAEMDSFKTAEQKAYEARLANYDREKSTATDLYTNLTLSAKTAAQSQINSLTTAWQQRRALLEHSNKANEANWTQQFLRFGQAEYSPGMTSDMITQKETEGMQKVKALDDEYTAKVNEINTAVEQNNYKRAAQLSSDLQTIEQNALTLMHENAREATAVNTQIRQKQMAVARDGAIASLVGQRVTDPAKILEVLNRNGYNVTAADVASSLKNLTLDNNPKNLSRDIATFNYIKNTYGLPKDIAALPPEQQYFAYLQTLKKAQATAATGFTLGTNQVRFDEQGKPIAYGPKGKEPGSTSFKFTSAQRSKLLAGNFTDADLTTIQGDLATHSIDDVAAGLPDDQKNLLQSVLSGKSGNTAQFLTTDYLANLFSDTDLKQAAADAGYRHLLTSWDTERQNYLDHLMQVVTQYRQAGYTDQQILDKMK